MNRRSLLLVAAAALLACGGEDQQTASVEREDFAEARQAIDPAARARIDSGNVAFRAERYAEALRHYEAATLLDEDAAAGWFGVFMAQRALGDAAAAEAALRRAHEAAPAASLVTPGEPAVPPDTGGER